MRLAAVFLVAVLLYLPTVRYDFVQDDRGIIARNPAAQSVGAALRAWDDTYWPAPSRAGLYRPLTILSYAVDWQLSGGRPGWFHFSNALWHALVTLLVALVLARWLPPVGAMAAALIFAVHPVHVEGVASVVSRAELLAAAAMLGAVLAARRRWWIAATLCTAAAMFSKEHGVVTGVVILLDDWLQPPEGGGKRYPTGLYVALALVTVGYFAVWYSVGRIATADMAPAFAGTGAGGRLAVALPAICRAAGLLVWPLDLSADYNPQVIPARDGVSVAALCGVAVVVAVPLLAWWCRRRLPAVTFAAGVAMLTYLPTSNLLFPAGVVLAERNLYLPVLLVAAAAGVAVAWAARRWDTRRAAVGLALLAVALVARSWARLPTWESNKSLVVTTIAEHPESYRAHVWAASVLSGMGDTAGARAAYARAGELFDRDPNLDGAHAHYLVLGLGDTAAAKPLIERARRAIPDQPFALRAQVVLLLRRGDRAAARALADSAVRWFAWDAAFYEALFK